jgi:Na+/H+ antiporter NhaD/arsenite permease-like protein
VVSREVWSARHAAVDDEEFPHARIRPAIRFPDGRPLTNDLVQAGGAAAEPLWWSLALGADLGGNATAIGASANVVVLGIAARSGYPISFWTFTKYGLVVTAVTVALCLPYLWLRYFA